MLGCPAIRYSIIPQKGTLRLLSNDYLGQGIGTLGLHQGGIQVLNRISFISNLPLGFETNATEVAQLSGENRVKGIHKLYSDDGQLEGVILLCTIDGEHYQNEWIEEDSILKYYFYGVTVDGRKRFSPTYKDNEAVLNSPHNYPVFVFSRSRRGERFMYKGEYELIDTSQELDGSMYFILGLKNRASSHKLESIMIEDNENFPEGKEKERLHKYRERNPRLIAAVKHCFEEKYGRLFCEACGFDFGKAYGDRGDGYIEAHHTKPVSELEPGDSTSTDDILLVCANCHRIIHRERPWLTREQIMGLVDS